MPSWGPALIDDSKIGDKDMDGPRYWDTIFVSTGPHFFLLNDEPLLITIFFLQNRDAKDEQINK